MQPGLCSDLIFKLPNAQMALIFSIIDKYHQLRRVNWLTTYNGTISNVSHLATTLRVSKLYSTLDSVGLHWQQPHRMSLKFLSYHDHRTSRPVCEHPEGDCKL